MPTVLNSTYPMKKLPNNSYLANLWRKIKYQFCHRQPIPWFARNQCPECKIVFSTNLFRKCPMCGWSEKTVWVVVWRDQVEGVFKKQKSAEKYQAWLWSESNSKTTIYEMEIME